MTFGLLAILIFVVAAFLYAAVIPVNGRGWFLLIGSLLAVYWLQPPLPIRFSDYILPTATILLTIVTWWITRQSGDKKQSASIRDDKITLALTAALVIGLSLFRYVDADYRLTASRPPSPLAVIILLGLVGGTLAGIFWLLKRIPDSDRGSSHGRRSRWLLTVSIVLIVVLFVVLKTELLSSGLGRIWRGFTGQDTSLASPIDLQWLGFSFVAFRLLHTLRDRQTGLLPVLSLREYISYVIFFPSYTAGPIDRAERFVTDYRSLPLIKGLDAPRFALGLERIIIGLFKKFVIADLLVQGISLNASNATQAQSSLALWILLYGFALRIYFDFGGYSDIVIGIGILFGVRLPENFKRPYLRSNIAAFWQSWHITLSNWVRFYVFTPLSRWMLRQSWRPSSTVIVFIAHISTMIVIGLWHGVSINFLIWGLWHGIALFTHKVWSDRTRKWYRGLNDNLAIKRTWTVFTWFITFNYVTIGWVWFALPRLSQSTAVLGKMFGLGW
jgi:D-alanyl-lipoteichoic acid acyltransferase DltB (MBOAT superfamily)